MATALACNVISMLIYNVLTYPAFDGNQLNRPEFPVIPDCHKKNVNLILISDAASEDYESHLQLFLQIVDLFSAGEEQADSLRVAMAVSETDITGRPIATWLFQLGAFTKTSDIKRTILGDRTRPRDAISYIEAAIKSVISTDPASSKHTNEQNSDLSTTIFLVLTNPKTDFLQRKGLHPVHFYSEKKLFIVFVYPPKSKGKSIPCQDMVSSPCINMRSETLLEDHSVSIALCARCLHGWFGPFPPHGLSTIHSISGVKITPLQGYMSCYRTVFNENAEVYALKAAETCNVIGGSLVSIESNTELIFLRAELERLCLADERCSWNHTALFIGLRRNMNSLGKRFLWINGRPLTYRLWRKELPIGSYMHGCAVWRLNLDTWMDVGCGRLFRKGTPSLCEWTTIYNTNVLEIPLPGPPDESSIQRAINRAQVGKCDFKFNNTFFLMAAHFLVNTKDCFVHVNSSGKTQLVQTPLNRDWVFPCDGNDPWNAIQFNKVCDQVKDCSNGNDENLDICGVQTNKKTNLFFCATSMQTIAAEARCDLYEDCVDGSDEENCDTCRYGLCADGRCMPQTWLIDNEKDCLSLYGFLEPDWNTSINVEMDCAFICNVSSCVPWSKLGNGVVDCLGPEGPLDETLGAMERADCGDPLFPEWAPRCVFQRDRFGEMMGCRNMLHLQGCEDFACPVGYIKCPEAYCIPFHYLFNVVIDCPFGEDEYRNKDVSNIIFGYFKCGVKDSTFIHPDRICDGSRDCPGGSDEADCHVTCAEGFLCIGGVVVVDGYDAVKPLADLSFIDSRTRMIDMSNIDVSLVFSTISDLELSNLLDLRLSNCSLTHALISFQEFDRLSRLDMSYNLLRNITHSSSNLRAIFSGALSLRLLNLSHNALLEFFDTDTLRNNLNLRVLDLSHTALNTFPNMSWINHNLMHLKLSHTRITVLGDFLFPINQNTWSLETFDLRGNDIEEVHRFSLAGLKIMKEFLGDNFKLCCPQLRGKSIPQHTCHAPEDALSSCSELLSNNILKFFVWVLSVASLLGNISIITTHLIARKTVSSYTCTPLVTQLSASNLFMGIYLLIIVSKDAYLDGEYLWFDSEWRRSNLCRIAAYIATLSSEVSFMFILIITVERFLVIKYPATLFRLSRACIIISSTLVWTLGCFFAAVPLLPGAKQWDHSSSSAMCHALPVLTRSHSNLYAAVFISLKLPICLCASAVQLTIYKTTTSKLANFTATYVDSNNSSHHTFSLNYNVTANCQQLSFDIKRDLELTRRLTIIALTDLVCWLPVGIMGLVVLGGGRLAGEITAWTALVVVPLNAAFNPIIYSLPLLRSRIAKKIAKHMASREQQRTISEQHNNCSRL